MLAVTKKLLEQTGSCNICWILFQELVSSSPFSFHHIENFSDMSEEAWGAQESLLSQTDADVLGKPLAHLSKVINYAGILHFRGVSVMDYLSFIYSLFAS